MKKRRLIILMIFVLNLMTWPSVLMPSEANACNPEKLKQSMSRSINEGDYHSQNGDQQQAQKSYRSAISHSIKCLNDDRELRQDNNIIELTQVSMFKAGDCTRLSIFIDLVGNRDTKAALKSRYSDFKAKGFCKSEVVVECKTEFSTKPNAKGWSNIRVVSDNGTSYEIICIDKAYLYLSKGIYTFEEKIGDRIKKKKDISVDGMRGYYYRAFKLKTKPYSVEKVHKRTKHFRMVGASIAGIGTTATVAGLAMGSYAYMPFTNTSQASRYTLTSAADVLIWTGVPIALVGATFWYLGWFHKPGYSPDVLLMDEE